MTPKRESHSIIIVQTGSIGSLHNIEILVWFSLEILVLNSSLWCHNFLIYSEPLQESMNIIFHTWLLSFSLLCTDHKYTFDKNISKNIFFTHTWSHTNLICKCTKRVVEVKALKNTSQKFIFAKEVLICVCLPVYSDSFNYM